MPADESQTTLDTPVNGPLTGDPGVVPPGEHAAAYAPAAQDEVQRRRPVSKGLLRLISPVTGLVIWQLVSELGLVSAQKLPPPTKVWSTAVSLVTTDSPAFGTLQGALAVSLERVAVGFAVGAAAGAAPRGAAGLSRIGENAVDPLMQMLRTLPLFGLIPVFIVWFGIGEGPKILLIAIGAAIPLYLNTFAGIRSSTPSSASSARCCTCAAAS